MKTVRSFADAARQMPVAVAFPLAALVVLSIGGLLVSSYVADMTEAKPPPALVPARAPAQAAAAAPTDRQQRDAAALPAVQGKAGAPAQPPAGFTHFRVGERNVKRILLDGDRVWVGTSAGLIRYSPATDEYKLYDARSGLRASSVIFVGRIKGGIVAGTMGGGLSVLDPRTEQWEHYGAAEGLGDAFVNDVVQAANGDVWIATRSGVDRVRGGALRDRSSWEHFSVESTGGGLPNDRVYGLAEGRGGDVWLATESGIALHRGGTFRRLEGEAAFTVAVAVDRAGRLWAGTLGRGLLRFDGSEWRRYGVTEGLPGTNVFALHRDADGSLWMGTDKGVARMKDGKFRMLTTQDGLYSDTVFAVASAPEALWAGSFGGVARIRR